MERGAVGPGVWSDFSFTLSFYEYHDTRSVKIQLDLCHLLSMITGLSISGIYIKDPVGVRKLLGSPKAEADSPQCIRSYFEPAWVLCCFCNGHVFSMYMDKTRCMGSVY